MKRLTLALVLLLTLGATSLAEQVTKVGTSQIAFATRDDTFTTATSGTAVDVSSSGLKWYGLVVTGTGAVPTSWTVTLQVSLTGAPGSYRTVLTHTNTVDGNGDIVWISTPAPAFHFRSNVSAVVLGAATNIVVAIVGMN